MSAAQAPTQAGTGGGGGDEELDLLKPGKLYAKSQWESATTFHLVVPQAGYTKNKLTLNPTINPMDDLMRPWSVPHAEAEKDKDLMTYCDLDASGRAAEIMKNLTERYERGEKRVDKVLGVYIAAARPGCGGSDPQVAEVKNFKLKAIPTITLKPGENTHPQTYVTVPNFKAGVKEFKVELTVMGPIETIELSTDPAGKITAAPGGSGEGKLEIPVEEGKKYVISVPVPLTLTSSQSRTDYWDDYYAGYTLETWAGGNITLWAKAMGAAKGIMRTVKLRAESWASGWLQTTPTVRYRHTHC